MQHSTKIRTKVAGVALAAMLSGAGTVSAVAGNSLFGFAKHGADDTTIEIRGGKGADDPAGHARRGADDTQPDDRGGIRGGKGADDPAGHARRGADDTQPDDRGGIRGGKG